MQTPQRDLVLQSTARGFGRIGSRKADTYVLSWRTLIRTGQAANKLMIVCDGSAALRFSSANGKTLTLGFSEPGEVLGLSAAISARPHQVSTEALETAIRDGHLMVRYQYFRQLVSTKEVIG